MTETNDPRRVLREQRPRSARELSEALGVSKRTITRRWAEPRAEYRQRAAQRRAEVLRLREEEGLTFPQIAERMGTTVPAAKSLAQRAKRERAS